MGAVSWDAGGPVGVCSGCFLCSTRSGVLVVPGLLPGVWYTILDIDRFPDSVIEITLVSFTLIDFKL